MKRYSKTIIGLLSIGPSLLWAGETTVAPIQHGSLVYSEVTRKVASLKDHKVTLVRVRGPLPPNAPTAPVQSLLPLPKEEQAREDRLAKKAYAALNVTATVYLGGKTPVTELRWRNETGVREYHAWSNADFRYLTQLTELETETTVYSWFPLVDSIDLTTWTKDQAYPLPAWLRFTGDAPDYQLDPKIKDWKDQETTLAGLDYLHAYYQLNVRALKTAYDKRMSDARTEEIRLARNPPKKTDTVTYFWPIQSRRNPR